jgi:ABC-type bacteriocin/lantibiotic exporter with double-glycine peptidase domain
MSSRVRVFLSCVLVVTTLVVAGCDRNGVAPAKPPTRVLLDIKDRAWDPNRPDPDLGWCGEACIQMAMAHYGKEVPQAAINRAAGAGASVPEITAENMDTALRALGVACVPWDESNRDVEQFIEWIKDALRKGRPVICGIKTYPDEHPRWRLDHFVLAVGFDEAGLILNAQPEFGGQQHIDYDDLKALDTGEEALSFQSTHRQYFARAVTALR